MPSKGKRGKKRYFQSKKRIKSRRSLMAEKPSPIVQAPKPTPATTTTTKVMPGTVRYPYIGAEVRRIAILTGVIFIILIILARVLP